MRKPTTIISAVIALCFVLVFGALGIHYLTGSHAQTTQSCTISSIDVNSCRPWFGAVVDGYPGVPSGQGDQFHHMESLVGHKVDIDRDYVNAPASDSTATSTDNLPFAGSVGNNESYYAGEGYALNVNWDPAKKFSDAESTANGGTQYINDRINAAADDLVKFNTQHPNTKIFFTPWHEMNLHATVNTSDCKTPTPTWTTFYGTSSQFDAAWINIYNIFQAHHVKNVLWTLGYSSLQGFNCAVPYDWPGGQYVDWIDYDSYDHGGRTWANTIGDFYNVLKGQAGTTGQQINSKPWGVGEFGTGKNTDETNILAYWNDGATAVKNNTYPKLKLYLDFDDYVSHTDIGALTDYDSGGTSPDMKKEGAVNNLVAAIYGSSSPSPVPTISFTSPSSGATVSGSVSVSAAANVSSGSIKSVTVKAGTTVLATCSAATCSHAWDTTALSNGSVTLEADTTASDGKSASSTETVTVKNAHPVTVTPPSNITSPSQTTTSVGLAWKAGTDSKYPASQLSYQVARDGSSIGDTKSGMTAYSDSGLSPGTYYSYTLVTKDPANNSSSPSAAFTQKTKTPNCAQPAAPTNLNGSATSPTTVNLSWKAVSNPSAGCIITGYVVSRNSVPLSQPKTPGYVDGTATPATTYSYSVVAVETGNIAGKSATVSVTTPQSHAPDPGPTTPTNVAASALSSSQVNLTWGASADKVTGIKDYEVLRDGKQVGTSSATSFGDSGLSPSTTYHYQVMAVSGGSKTASSSTVSVTTLSGSNGGGRGSGSGGSSGSGTYIPPILQGTSSVGSGSDTGNDTTYNPTDPGSGTSNELSQGQSTPTSKNSKLSTKQVAYIGTGTTIVVIILAGGLWWWFRRRNVFQPSLYDPDIQSQVVVGSGRDDGQGPQSPYPPNTPPGGQY